MTTASSLQIIRDATRTLPRSSPFCWWALSVLVVVLGMAIILWEAVGGAVVETRRE